MTPAHGFQIALLGLGCLCFGWVVYREARGWLLKSRHGVIMVSEIEAVKSAKAINQGVIGRLIAEKITQRLTELEQDRQRLDEKRVEAQEKFREFEKQRYERKKALEQQIAAKIKEIGMLPQQHTVKSRPRGVKFNNLNTSCFVFQKSTHD